MGESDAGNGLRPRSPPQAPPPDRPESSKCISSEQIVLIRCGKFCFLLPRLATLSFQLMPQDSRPIYSIGAVARLLGLAPGTIRTWEDRYGVIAPKRSPSGRRLYSREEVEGLRFVKMRMDEGVQPADAHRLLAERAGADADVTGNRRRVGVRPLVLLAAGDPHTVDVMEYFLSQEGYDVDVAGDPADAERRFAALSPQLAIVELLLSGGEEMDLCRRLKERHTAPVLLISALDARDASLAASADAFLQKPLDPLVLVSTVKELLRSSTFVEADPGARP